MPEIPAPAVLAHATTDGAGHPQRKQSSPSLLDQARLHILMADDDEDDRDLFRDTIMDINKDIQVTTTSDGEVLIEMLDSMTALPDILFLDLNMPRKTGMLCLAELRAAERYRRLPIVIYSTGSDQVDHTYALGASLYLQKPTRYRQIRILVQKILNMRKVELVPQPPRHSFEVV